MNQICAHEKPFTSSLVRTLRRVSVPSLLICALLNICLAGQLSGAQQRRMGQLQRQPQGNSYETFYYKSGNLNIEAYFYKPEGNGPFPLVIYNHGSRAGNERQEVPFKYVANVLQANGFAVVVPERRGYGKSDGPTFGEEVGKDIGQVMMRRFREEASDVLAGLTYLKRQESLAESDRFRPAAGLIDFNRVAIMGWSHGGVVSLLTASERHEFAALINQAGGALTWNHSPTLQTELAAAAKRIQVPALCMDAENDATTNAVKVVGEAIKSSGQFERTIIYPPFTPTSNPSNIAPGHLIFSMQGISIWQNDMLTFLERRLKPNQPERISLLDNRSKP